MNEIQNFKGGLTMDICGDNRFEIIEKAKQDLLESTNISSNEDEIKVLDRFLFRCWQMGWLDKYNEESGCEANCTTKNEDLEEAARYYLLNNHVSPLNDILHQADLKVEMQYHKDIENTFKASAEWQKQKMMKNAVDCVFGSRATSAFVDDFPNIEIGDKVKIIIIKED